MRQLIVSVSLSAVEDKLKNCIPIKVIIQIIFYYYVYILKCSDNSYYTGITNNLEKRVKEHQFGFNKESYTYKRRPLVLEFHQEFFNDVLQAIYFEKKIKGWTRKKKEALI